jgi:arabinogalactan endo-1,4-beta-galactosidase
MKSSIYLLILLSGLILTVSCCQKKDTNNDPLPPPPEESDYFRGVDLSFQQEIKNWQTKYYDSSGQEIELLPFLAAKGVNLVRLRLWHSPAGDYNGLESVVAYAKEVKANGMEILLDIHYSDTWADPGHQYLPAAWEGLNNNQLSDSIYAYTRFVLNRFGEEGALPVIVQAGNETNSGFLWDQGRVGGAFNNNWTSYTTLVKSAVKAIREVSGETGSDIRVMLHIAGVNSASWFFDNITQYLVDYDVIGLSY